VRAGVVVALKAARLVQHDVRLVVQPVADQVKDGVDDHR
jgi:hypothetical protein